MKALVWHGKEDVRVDNVPDPKLIDPTDVIVKITSTAICGSDLHLYDGYQPTMEKGDILEARLIPFDGALVFSSAFCFHPREAVKAIKKEVKRRKKEMPDAPPLELTWEAAKRALKADRYRQIAVDKIYDFEGSRL